MFSFYFECILTYPVVQTETGEPIRIVTTRFEKHECLLSRQLDGFRGHAVDACRYLFDFVHVDNPIAEGTGRRLHVHIQKRQLDPLRVRSPDKVRAPLVGRVGQGVSRRLQASLLAVIEIAMWCQLAGRFCRNQEVP